MAPQEFDRLVLARLDIRQPSPKVPMKDDRHECNKSRIARQQYRRGGINGVDRALA
jgi:hypothetical protein